MSIWPFRRHERMPIWRERYVTSRRHPLALAAYAVTMVFGLLFLTGVMDTSVVFAELNPIWQILWEWELFLGGGLAFLSCAIRPRQWPHYPDLADMLRSEGVGALVGGLGMGTYSVVLVTLLGWSSYAWILMALLGLGMIVRAIQAMIESTRVEQLGVLTKVAQDIILEANRRHIESGGTLPYNPYGDLPSGD